MAQVGQPMCLPRPSRRATGSRLAVRPARSRPVMGSICRPAPACPTRQSGRTRLASATAVAAGRRCSRPAPASRSAPGSASSSAPSASLARLGGSYHPGRLASTCTSAWISASPPICAAGHSKRRASPRASRRRVQHHLGQPTPILAAGLPRHPGAGEWHARAHCLRTRRPNPQRGAGAAAPPGHSAATLLEPADPDRPDGTWWSPGNDDRANEVPGALVGPAILDWLAWLWCFLLGWLPWAGC